MLSKFTDLSVLVITYKIDHKIILLAASTLIRFRLALLIIQKLMLCGKEKKKIGNQTACILARRKRGGVTTPL